MRKTRKRQSDYNVGRFMIITVIITVVAVYSGFLATKFIVAPFFLSEGNSIADQGDNNGISGETSGTDNDPADNSEDEVVAQDGTLTTLYTLQFGTYSSLENANEAINQLSYLNIYGYPAEIDGAYKVYSLLFNEKEIAVGFRNGYVSMGTDCFVATRDCMVSSNYNMKMVQSLTDLIYDISSGEQTGDQRKEIVQNRLNELSSAYTGDFEKPLIDELKRQSEQIAGSDNQILFQLQKEIIMIIEKTFV